MIVKLTLKRMWSREMTKFAAGLLCALILPAIAAIAAIAEGPTTSAVAAFDEAQKLARGGDSVSALAAFERALRADPDNLRYGSEYRQVVVHLKAYDRAIEFFKELVEAHPTAANAHLNLGYAFVDSSPDEGAVTQVLLADTALKHFSAALEAEDCWLVRYTRGNSYLYWPPIFGRTHLGIEDLKQAIWLARGEDPKAYHVRAWVALGDGHFRMDDPEAAKKVWRQGLQQFPGDGELEKRLQANAEELEALIDDAYATDKRVDTDLSPIWTAR